MSMQTTNKTYSMLCDAFNKLVDDLSTEYKPAEHSPTHDVTEAKHIRSLFRHAVAEMPGENPELWGWLINRVPEDLQGKGAEVSYGEYALYIALSMYVIGPRENKKLKLAGATAVAKLKRQKLAMIETATDINEFQTKLRRLVKLIGSDDIGFDYRELVKDIYLWQTNKVAIARKWERDYYAQKENRNE